MKSGHCFTSTSGSGTVLPGGAAMHHDVVDSSHCVVVFKMLVDSRFFHTDSSPSKKFSLFEKAQFHPAVSDEIFASRASGA